MKTIGVLYISTGRYKTFWHSFHESAEQYLFADGARYRKHYFVYTDEPAFFPCPEAIHLTRIPRDPWPDVALKRSEYLLLAAPLWRRLDIEYLYFFNGNSRFLRPLHDSLLPARGRPLVFALHPYYPQSRRPEVLPYDRNRRSTAYVARGHGRHYFMSGLYGGERDAFIALSRELRRRTDSDDANGVVAAWHDESHLNRYGIDHPDALTVLPHTTTVPDRLDNGAPLHQGPILIQDKRRPCFGGHAWLRGQLPSRITVQLQGGLGNQLWQYIAGLAQVAVQRRNGVEVELDLDLGWFQRYGRSQPPRTFRLHKLFADLRTVTDPPDGLLDGYAVYAEPVPWQFSEDFLHLAPAVILRGFFQHPRYLELAGDLFRPKLPALSRQHARLRQDHELVAVHVRRGDFLQEREPSGVVPPAYYRGALAGVRRQVARPYCLLFSDEPDWARKQLGPMFDAYGLDWQGVATQGPDADVADFCLMARCRHFVCANSGFSALAALIGGRPDASLVYVPRLRLQGLNLAFADCSPAYWQTPDYPFFTGAPAEPIQISLVIPVIDHHAYLQRSLESACGQPQGGVEIIVADASADPRCRALIEDCRRRDPRLRAIRHPVPQGYAAAANSGIEAARGEWLMFLDSRDYLRADALAVLSQTAAAAPRVDLIMADSLGVQVNGRIFAYNNDFAACDLRDPLAALLRDRLPALRLCAGGKLWRRDLFTQHAIRFPDGLRAADLATTPRLLSRCRRARIIRDRLYFHQHGAGGADIRPADVQAACDDLRTWGEALPRGLRLLLAGFCARQQRWWQVRAGWPSAANGAAPVGKIIEDGWVRLLAALFPGHRSACPGSPGFATRQVQWCLTGRLSRAEKLGFLIRLILHKLPPDC
jgi:hypothetical protein